MFRIDISAVGNARDKVKQFCEVARGANDDTSRFNRVLAGTNSGQYVRASQVQFKELSNSLSAMREGLKQYYRALSDAHDALDGRVRAARDRVLAASGGSVSGRDMLSFGRTGVMSACDDAEDAAVELARGGAFAADKSDALGESEQTFIRNMQE